VLELDPTLEDAAPVVALALVPETIPDEDNGREADELPEEDQPDKEVELPSEGADASKFGSRGSRTSDAAHPLPSSAQAMNILTLEFERRSSQFELGRMAAAHRKRHARRQGKIPTSTAPPVHWGMAHCRTEWSRNDQFVGRSTASQRPQNLKDAWREVANSGPRESTLARATTLGHPGAPHRVRSRPHRGTLHAPGLGAGEDQGMEGLANSENAKIIILGTDKAVPLVDLK
jgi:hypothetical protein